MTVKSVVVQGNILHKECAVLYNRTVRSGKEKAVRKEDLSFSEPYAAAKSLKNFWTKMASTYKCISVGVSGKILIIRPNWYIGWAIYLLGLDLYHEIRVDNIKSVQENIRQRLC